MWRNWGRTDSEGLGFLMQKNLGKGFTKGVELELNLILFYFFKALRGREESEEGLLHRRTWEAARGTSGGETFPPGPAEPAGAGARGQAGCWPGSRPPRQPVSRIKLTLALCQGPDHARAFSSSRFVPSLLFGTAVCLRRGPLWLQTARTSVNFCRDSACSAFQTS